MSEKFKPTIEQQQVLDNTCNNVIVSSSAGTGKTAILIEYIAQLIDKGANVSRMLVLTFTNNASKEMKERLVAKLMSSKNPNVFDILDDVYISDISTIHSFLQKVIKRNIDKVDVKEGFSLLDGLKSQQIKNAAFENVFNKTCSEKEFENLFISSNNEKENLKNIIFELENHFASITDKFEKTEFYKNSQNDFIKQANECFNHKICDFFQSAFKIVKSYFLTTDENSKTFEFTKRFYNELKKISSNNSLYENLKNMQTICLTGGVNSWKIFDDDFVSLKEEVKSFVKSFSSWDIEEKGFWNVNENLNLIYRLFSLYESEVSLLKEQENAIDFNDLERITEKLFSNKEFLEELANKYDFIFIDEYQDTNPVQESLVKKLSKNSMFIAVGDLKQGIYGFRNATFEIMQNDIHNAENNNGNVIYLRSNFRSDPKILEFVNQVFVPCMKEENFGINYEKTSLLKGEIKFPTQSLASVRIDIVEPMEKNKEDKKIKIYDVFEDEGFKSSKFENEAYQIAHRINEMMLEKRYDLKTKKLKQIQFKDISILVRKRGELVEKIIEVFGKTGIPIVSNIDKQIDNGEEISVLKALLKIAVDFQDDVSLCSFMTSKLGGYSCDDILILKNQNDAKKSLYEIVFENEEKILKIIDDFKTQASVKGVGFAFENLFSKTDYYSYLLTKENGINEKNQVKSFINIISKSGYNFNIPALIKYLNSNSINSKCNVGKSENAVTISTIHSSKGLEYPVVILPGMTNNLISHDNTKTFFIDKKMGLILNFLNEKTGKKSAGLLMKFAKSLKHKKEIIDEIMLLYVALTRAKNHLYITGENNIKFEKINSVKNIFEQTSFISIIFNSLKIKKPENYKNDILEINFLNNLEIKEKKPVLINNRGDENLENEIKKYLSFNYTHKNSTTLKFKNSVTSLNTEKNENKKFILTENNSSNLEVGNAYHKALEILNFEKINSIIDLQMFLEKEELKDLIDFEILFNNINLIKGLTNKQELLKEKQFTMKLKLNEIFENSSDEEIMVQGVVDLISIGEKNILIDFKYSDIKNENKLKEKYFYQLKIYKLAVEKAFNINLDEIYILSLKNSKLIKLK